MHGRAGMVAFVPPNLSLTQNTLCWPGLALLLGPSPSSEVQCREHSAVWLIQPGAHPTAVGACLPLPAALPALFSVLLLLLTFLSPLQEGRSSRPGQPLRS